MIICHENRVAIMFGVYNTLKRQSQLGESMKILFISSNRIGDAVLTMGVLMRLQDTYPEARFTIACGPVTQGSFRAVPRVDRMINLKKQKRHGHWIDLWKSFRIGTRWDIVSICATVS